MCLTHHNNSDVVLASTMQFSLCFLGALYGRLCEGDGGGCGGWHDPKSTFEERLRKLEDVVTPMKNYVGTATANMGTLLETSETTNKKIQMLMQDLAEVRELILGGKERTCMNDEGGSWHAKGHAEIGKRDHQVSHIVSGVNGSNCCREVAGSELDGTQRSILEGECAHGGGEENAVVKEYVVELVEVVAATLPTIQKHDRGVVVASGGVTSPIDIDDEVSPNRVLSSGGVERVVGTLKSVAGKTTNAYQRKRKGKNVAGVGAGVDHKRKRTRTTRQGEDENDDTTTVSGSPTRPQSKNSAMVVAPIAKAMSTCQVKGKFPSWLCWEMNPCASHIC